MTGQRLEAAQKIRSLSFLRLFAGISIASILIWMISREAAAWLRFDWGTFYGNAREISVLHASLALALMYASFALRAVRWRVFLESGQPPQLARLFAATVVGFTGLALLGRAGELVRPYVIARQTNSSVTSQMAILALERMFDLAAAAFLIAIAIATSPEVRSLPYLTQFRHAGLLLLGALATAVGLVVILATKGHKLGTVCERMLSLVSDRLARIGGKALSRISADLNRVRGAQSFFLVSALSILVWLAIGIAHFESIHAFASLHSISVADAFLLLGFSLLGTLVSLPGGGAQQVAFAAALIHVFGVPVELAASCTILGWLLLFMAPVPAGLALLRRQHLSLQSVEQSASSCASQ